MADLRELEQRFWSKVDKSAGPDECWPWLGATSRRYGRIHVNGKRVPAARVAWELANGEPMPDGLFACHKCDNPPCCNPAHIWPGTQKQNMDDAVQKGRSTAPDPAKSGWQKSKTHCKQGHPLSGDNVFLNRRGYRQCRECHRRGCEERRKRYASSVRAWAVRQAEARRNEGRCGRCGNERDTPGRKLCQACRTKMREYAQRVRSVGDGDHLLTHPEAVEAVEVLRAWGRAKVAAIDTGSALFRAEHAHEYDGGPREAWEQAGNAHLVARAAETHAESVASNLAMQMALADALAGEVG